MIASSSIAVSRKILGFNKIWIKELEILSDFKEEEIKVCMEHLYTVYHDDQFRQHFII